MEWIAIALGVVGLIGSIVSGVVNYNSQQETNDLQRQLANQANQFQIENRDYENYYNSPAGLQSRGLNPSLAMSASGGSLAQSVSAGQANLPSDIKAPQIGDFGKSVNDSALTASQISLNNAEARRLDTQNQIDWGNLDETQKRTIILQQEADTERSRVDSYIDDIKNIIEMRGKDFDLRQAQFDFSKSISEEKLKQGWEQIGIDKENLRISQELLPFMKQKYKAECTELFAQAYELIQRGDYESAQSELAQINLRLERVLESARNEVNDLIKKGEQEKVLAILEENRLKENQFGHLADAWQGIDDPHRNDVDLWQLYLYSLSSGRSDLNPSMFFDTRGPAKSAKKAFKPKPPKVKGFGK